MLQTTQSSGCGDGVMGLWFLVAKTLLRIPQVLARPGHYGTVSRNPAGSEHLCPRDSRMVFWAQVGRRRCLCPNLAGLYPLSGQPLPGDGLTCLPALLPPL